MNFRSTLGLGLRLVVGGGRHGITRLLLMAAGVAVGVSLLIGGLGIAPALQARNARALGRSPVFGEGTKARDYLLWSATVDRIGDAPFVRYTVAAVGRAPVPPGLTRLPRPGEKFVSPSLAGALRSPLGVIAARRVPGRVAGPVSPEGLVYPGERIAYIGAEPSFFGSADSIPVVQFGREAGVSRQPIRVVIRLLILLGVLGLLIPTLVFVATSTRLSAASRERRLAAIRLVGATPGQARVLAAVESGVAAALGSALGVVLFFVLRPVVAGLGVGGYRWFPSDMAPPAGQAVAVALAAPVLAMGAALFSLRRLIVTPLGVTRRAGVRRSGAIRLVPLAAGLAGFGGCWIARRTVSEGGPGSLAAVGMSFFLVVVGLAAVAPWLGAAVAPLYAGGRRGLGALLGARRLQADPTAAGRVVGAMALLVFVAGVVHGLVPTGTESGADAALSLRPAATLIEGRLLGVRRVQRSFGGVQGVRAVVPLATVEAVTPGAGDAGTTDGFGAWIADCARLRAVLIERFPGCGPRTGFVSGSLRPNPVRPGAVVHVLLDRDRGRWAARLRIPNDVRAASLRTGAWQLGTDVILPPSSLPSGARRHLQAFRTVVATDGTAATLERVRNAAAAFGPGMQVRTLEEGRADAARDTRQITSPLDLGVLLAVAIALANLLIVSIDHVQERRRPLAVLAATGVPIGVLRRSVAVEVAVPLGCATLLSVGVALAVSAIFGSIVSEPVTLPVGPLAVLAALAVGSVAVVTGLTLPSLARAARPETLRME